MKVLLVFGQEDALKVVVHLHTEELRTRFSDLIRESRFAEAFNVAVSEAMVHEYVPPGYSASSNPRMALYETVGQD